MERKGDTEKRPRTSMGKPVKPHNSIKTFHSLYFLTSSSPFKALIRISNEKLNTMSIVNQLQTAFKTVSGENTHVIFFFFFVVLLAVSVFVIINTVNMTVFSRKDEIYVMRFVGAGRWFISLPFVLEGIILGAFSGGVSYFIMKWLSGYVVESVVTGLDMLTVLPFEAYSSVILWGSLGIGVVCGVIGSTISIGRPLEA